MIPILYERGESGFSTNGLGRLRDCISCVVTEERNGIYECDFEYPINGQNFDKIQPGRIIAVEHDQSDDVQPFDIVSYSKPISGIVTFHAVHVSYRLNKIVASGTGVNSLSEALTLIRSAQPSNPFTYAAGFEDTGFMASADGIPRSVRSFLGGVEGSILDTYGGEYTFDKFNVQLSRARGVDRNLTIRYGVNLVDYQEDVDYLESYSACVPYWTGSDDSGAESIVKGGLINSGLETISGRIDTVPLDLTEKFESKPTKAQVENMARSLMNSRNVNLPSNSIKVDFVSLENTLEYAELKPLLYCGLCDTVRVIFPMYGMSGRFKIVKTEYDVLSERFKSLELGTLSTTLAEALGVQSGGSVQSGGGGGGMPELEILTPTITVTSGEISQITLLKWGRSVQFSARFAKNTATAAGSNVFAGSMEEQYRPITFATGAGYQGGASGVLQIATNGDIRVRATGGQVAADSGIYISASYFI